MNDAPSDSSAASGRTGASLRVRLLIGLNGAVVLVLAAFLAWDYHTEWRRRLAAKRAALQEEAEALLVSVRQHRNQPERVQRYIDQVCARMRDTSSPGHHIVVELGERVLQAHAHHRASPAMYRAMRRAAASSDRGAEVQSQRIVVGSSGDDRTALYVSEWLSDLEWTIREQLARRMLSIAALGVVLALVVTLLVDRMITRPLNRVVQAVQHVATGKLGTHAPPTKTRELAFLVEEFNAMSSALASAQRERRQQMEKARRVQEHLHPTVEPALGLAAAHAFEPATEVAGDYFDILPRRDRTALVCIADATGHGVPAAMGAAMLKTLLLTAAREAADPAAILAEVNTGFSAVCLPEDFASLCLVAIAPDRRELCYASAGHEPALLLRASGETDTLPSTGPLLAIAEGGLWRSRAVPLSPGDRLVLTTDGLAEALSPDGEPFGRQRLHDAVERCRHRPLDRFCQAVLDAIRDFEAPGGPQDDKTILAVEV
jgi:sigma-B regulation protein RsbU (phosphoserine phosphatase)